MKCGEEDDERRNGKHQYGTALVPAESVAKRQRENTEEKMTSLHRWTLCSLSEKEDKKIRQQKMNSLLPIWQRRQENKMMKDEFSASYMKKKTEPC